MAYAIEFGGTSLCRAREGLVQTFPSGSAADRRGDTRGRLDLTNPDRSSHDAGKGATDAIALPLRGYGRDQFAVFGSRAGFAPAVDSQPVAAFGIDQRLVGVGDVGSFQVGYGVP